MKAVATHVLIDSADVSHVDHFESLDISRRCGYSNVRKV